MTPDDALATRAKRLGRVGWEWGCRRLVDEDGEDGEDGMGGAGAPVAKRTLPTSFRVLLSTLSSCEAFGEPSGGGVGGDGARGGSTLRGATKNVSAHVGRIRFGGAGAAGAFFGYAGAGDDGRVGGALVVVVVEVMVVVVRVVFVVVVTPAAPPGAGLRWRGARDALRLRSVSSRVPVGAPALSVRPRASGATSSSKSISITSTPFESRTTSLGSIVRPPSIFTRERAVK